MTTGIKTSLQHSTKSAQITRVSIALEHLKDTYADNAIEQIVDAIAAQFRILRSIVVTNSTLPLDSAQPQV